MQENHTDRFHKQRISMVQTRIKARGVKDPAVLRAMEKVERHKFVPASMQSVAYLDRPLPIGYDQTISQPYIVAYMTEVVEIKPGDKILEIGTGSGYQAAVLAEIADSVFTIEIVKPLAEQSADLLQSLGYSNIFVKAGDGYAGWPENAPFDVIMLTAAPSEIPRPLIDQLNEGGRLIAPVGKFYQELQLLMKINGQIQKKKLLPVRFVPMTGKAQE